MRSNRWDEPAGRYRPEVDCLTPAVRLANSDAYRIGNALANAYVPAGRFPRAVDTGSACRG